MACVPDDAIDRFAELTTGEERLYTRLCRFVCRDPQHKDYRLAWPSRSKLAEMMGCNESHVSDLVNGLSRKGWVTKIGWKYRLLVGDFLLNSPLIPTIEPRKSRNNPTKTETNSRNIPTLSDTETLQLSESDREIVGIQDVNCRNLGSQLSEFEPTVRKNQHEPVIEPDKNQSEARARELDTEPFNSSEIPGSLKSAKLENGAIVKWLEKNAPHDVLTPGSFAFNLVKARFNDGEFPIDEQNYRIWILNCFEDIGPPGNYANFDLWKREVNTCLKNSRVTGRYCSPKKGNGKNGNGRYKSKAEKTNDSWRELAEQLAAEGD